VGTLVVAPTAAARSARLGDTGRRGGGEAATGA